MKRFDITFTKPGIIFAAPGLIHSVIALNNAKAEVVVYVENKNTSAFNRALKTNSDVKAVTVHALDLEGRVKAAQAAQAKGARP